MKVLLAEDTPDLNKVLSTVLAHEGYAVDAVFDGMEATERLETDAYDCIVLDIMMPKKDGIQVLTELRQKNIITPVLMLTAKAEVEDRVTGLDAGADDYLTKPFAIKELLARVRALTRRKTQYQSSDLSYQDLSLKSASFELGSENTVRLSVKEFELMQMLILNAGHTLSTAYLREHVWSDDPDAADGTVYLYVSYLKRKLKAIASAVTINGSPQEGYALV